MLLVAGISGCARWQPETGEALAALPPACPLKRGPVVANFGETGVAGVYQFVTQDAPESDVAAFLKASEAAGFDVMLMTLSINGKDTLIATGHETLRTQDQTDREFALACSLGHSKVYLTNARYDPRDPTGTARAR